MGSCPGQGRGPMGGGGGEGGGCEVPTKDLNNMYVANQEFEFLVMFEVDSAPVYVNSFAF